MRSTEREKSFLNDAEKMDLTKVLQVYKNIKGNLSHKAYTDDVAILHLAGCEIGNINNNYSFPPTVVDTCFEILRAKTAEFFRGRPFFLTAERDVAECR